MYSFKGLCLTKSFLHVYKQNKREPTMPALSGMYPQTHTAYLQEADSASALKYTSANVYRYSVVSLAFFELKSNHCKHDFNISIRISSSE